MYIRVLPGTAERKDMKRSRKLSIVADSNRHYVEAVERKSL